MTAGKRIFPLINPDFASKDHAVEVSEVYIDPPTCDKYLFERFITYLANYPPKGGIKAVQIFHTGNLADLGENLKNTLQNNFEHVEQIH